MRWLKRAVEAASKPYFTGAVRAAYRARDGSSHRRVQTMARREYGLDPSGALARGTARWFMDFVRQVQLELHRDGEAAVDLGEVPIGFQGLRIHASSGDANSSAVYLYGFSDNHTVFELYRRHARPGTVALDVGANLGMHSLVLSRCVSPGGRVLAYEPLESIHARLLRNLEINGARMVTPRRAGIGDRSGELGFDDRAGEYNIGKGALSEDGRLRVPVTTIDLETADLDVPVSLIKLDIEGREVAALRGARETLERFKPVILCEFSPTDYTFRDLLGAIPYGVDCYRVHYLAGAPVETIRDDAFDTRADVLMVPKSPTP